MEKAILFDLDDTLYDYTSTHKIALQKVKEKASEILDVTEDEFDSLYGEARKHFVEELTGSPAYHSRTLYFQRIVEKKFGKPNPEKTLELYETFWSEFLKNMSPREGLIELFEYFKEKKIKIGVTTNMTTYAQLKKITVLNITKYLDCIVTSNEIGTEKPKSPIFLIALNKIGCSPQETIFVGDDPEKDIIGAKKVGMRTILIKTKKNSGQEETADYAVKNLLEIKNIFERL